MAPPRRVADVHEGIACRPPARRLTDGRASYGPRRRTPTAQEGGYEMVDGLGATKDGRNVTVYVNQDLRYGRRR
jgi:hypothetical protein